MSTFEKRIELSTMHLKDDPQRIQHIEEGENQVKKPRFGLFSHLLPNCIGEDTYSRRPFTSIEPYNMKIGPMKKGNCGEALFAKPAYCTIKQVLGENIFLQIIKKQVNNLKEIFIQILENLEEEILLLAIYFHNIDMKKIHTKEKKNLNQNLKLKKRKNFYHKKLIVALLIQNRILLQIKILIKLQTHHDRFFSKYPPFRPANPPKKGYNMTINSFPVYQEEPPLVPWSAKEARTKTMKQFPPWKPNSPGTFAQPHFALTNKSVKLDTEKFALFKRAII